MFQYFYFIFEALALITAVIQYKKIEKTPYVYFLPYLLLIILYETGSYFKIFVINHGNAWITNIIISIEFLFYSCFIIVLLAKKLRARLVLLVVGTLLFTMIDVLAIQGFWNLGTIAILVQYVVLIILVCTFFSQLMRHPGHQLSLISLPDFWVNTGLLFFCLAEFMFFAAFTYMMAKNNYGYYMFWLVISNMANLILYSCLSISFICFNKKKLSY